MRRQMVHAAATAAVLAAVTVAAPVVGSAAAQETAAPTFEPYESYPTGSWPESVAIADFTGDGRADVALSTSVYGDSANNSKVLMFVQQADGGLALSSTLDTGGLYGDDMGLRAGDFDGDGLADLALATGGGIDVFFQRDGTLAPRQQVADLAGRHLEVADVHGDGDVDIVLNGAGVWLVPGTGTTAFGVPVLVTADALSEVELGDVTGDGFVDMVGFTGKTVKVYAQQTGGGFAEAASYDAVVGYSSTGAGIEVADLTGDGRLDVALSIAGNQPGALVNVFAQQADGTLAEPVVHSVLDIPEPLEAADLTGDGRADLVTAHGGWNAAGVLVQEPDGSLATEATFGLPYASHYNPKGLALGDVNGDGRIDIAVADYNHGLVVLRQGDPTPTTTTTTTTTTTVPDGDTDPPETTLTDVDPDGSTVYGDSIRFSFVSDEADSSFLCSLNGDVHKCTSPTTYTTLAEGAHTFQVAATDPAGNADPTPATWQFQVAYPTDLAVSMTDSPDPVRPKAELTYAITVTNRSKTSTDSVTVEHVRSSGSDIAHLPANCALGPDNSTIRCSVGTLAPQQSTTYEITVKVTAPKGTELHAAATVTSDRVDSDPGDNEATTTTLVWPGRR